MKPHLRYMLCAALLAALLPARAEEARVSIDQLGDLNLVFASVQQRDEVPGPALQARATHRGSAMYRIDLPRDVRRASYLVENGDRVSAGQPFVVLDGPEIHHLLLEYSTLGTRYESARERYERSREPYRQQALREEQWVEIADRYFALRLEFEHMRHFQELVRESTDRSEAITLVAPIDGRIQYHDNPEHLVAGTEIAGFLAADALRLQARVPTALAGDLAALELPACRLAVAAVGGVYPGR